ncbi:hypothetical protein JIN84_18425 [Luteolibacter yonseiensis]|uniref:Glycosyl hydrolase family 98 putative carbohydrate-binding module domain-containing protein n=1 Tax=Luteolibacter yonseiensis TaxID=1144680 RepID=A0A934R5K1_9BACT|nr:hypothetical protein [Luteolibacter yonseiensis]MBK1817601.1 hypothetical protein [Luteolibacter yonseiensis]
MRLRVFILWLLAIAAAHSNSIIAWNYPLAGYQEGGPKRKLDAPPEPSVFFSQGDILHDITPPVPAVKDKPDTKLDWLIWNETSGLIVSKGPWQAIYMFADTVRMGEVLSSAKVIVDVFELAEGKQATKDARPACSFSVVARNGKPVTLKQTSGPWNIDFEAVPHINEWHVDEEIRFSTRFQLSLTKGDETLKIQTAVRSHANRAVRLGRSIRDGRGFEVRATFQLLRPDGQILETGISEERNGEAKPLDRALVARNKSAEGWFESILISPEILYEMSPDKSTDDADPFAERPPEGFFRKPRFHFPLVDLATGTIAASGRPLWDVSGLFAGLALKPGERISYDPLCDQLHILATDEELFGKLDMLFMGCHLDPPNLAVTITGQDELSVAVISNGKGLISQANHKGEILNSLETDAVLGEGEGIIEVNLEMRHGCPQNVFKTTGIVWNGGKTQLGSAATQGEAETPWMLQAEVLRQEDSP